MDQQDVWTGDYHAWCRPRRRRGSHVARQLGVFLGLSGYAEAVPKLFAWAAVSVHEETYDEWPATQGLSELFPYANSAGEVDHWRLELKVNELGRAFLVVDQFATGGSSQLTP